MLALALGNQASRLIVGNWCYKQCWQQAITNEQSNCWLRTSEWPCWIWWSVDCLQSVSRVQLWLGSPVSWKFQDGDHFSWPKTAKASHSATGNHTLTLHVVPWDQSFAATNAKESTLMHSSRGKRHCSSIHGINSFSPVWLAHRRYTRLLGLSCRMQLATHVVCIARKLSANNYWSLLITINNY